MSIRATAPKHARCDTYVIEGGLDAWKRAGLRVVTDRKQPIEFSET